MHLITKTAQNYNLDSINHTAKPAVFLFFNNYFFALIQCMVYFSHFMSKLIIRFVLFFLYRFPFDSKLNAEIMPNE